MKIFFDLDGTLLDVSERHYKVYSEVALSLGGAPLPKADYWDLKREKTAWEIILPKSSIPADSKDAFLEAFIPKIEATEYLRMDALFPHAIGQLEGVAKDHECYLVSLRRNHENLLAELEWLQLRPHFIKILSGHSESDGSDVKTAIIKRELGEDKGMIIGDTEADILTGKSLDLVTVAVLSGIRAQSFLETLKPDYMINSISELNSVAL